jgi:zinc-ribbon family
MSFILIGFGRRTHKDLGETGTVQTCARCSNSIFYHLVSSHTWFTCFFIPIFPYRSAYRIECPVCFHGIELRRSEIKAAKQGTLNVYVSSD